jgi:polysaccharide pyruvyl transferase WcaK-like protein
MIAVTHAFSRRNAGDSLLVDLTLSRLERAGVPASECCVIALDAGSFHDLPHVHQVPGEPWKKVSLRLVPAGAQLGMSSLAVWSRGRLRFGELAGIIGGATGLVGVGGGYLRSGTAVEAVGCLVNHVPQLALVAESKAPSIYLPQSTGPLRGPVGRIIGRLLRRVDLVCVRDDESMDDLRPYVAASRLPDLAVLRLAEELSLAPPEERSGGQHVVFVGRALRGTAGFGESLVRLSDQVRPVTWAIQSDALGKKSDRRFYKRLGREARGSVLEVLEQLGSGVVVSVRLHGALQALLAGWPAIHLSYDRKGRGAYQDLGLDSFVHDARRFDPGLVAGQVESLRRDPGGYWAAVEARRTELLRASETLSVELRRRLRPSLPASRTSPGSTT